MEQNKELEQKLEQLIAQLNELLTQLSGDDKPQATEPTILDENASKVQNLEMQLQRLKAQRKPVEPKEICKESKHNGCNYVSSSQQRQTPSR